MQTNILGTTLTTCCKNPITGFYRDGLCRATPEDRAVHSVCAIVTNKFLEFSKQQGNDLTTPIPAYGFPGLKEGDKWCLCILRWIEAHKAGVAPRILAKATSIESTKYISKEILLEYAI